MSALVVIMALVQVGAREVPPMTQPQSILMPGPPVPRPPPGSRSSGLPERVRANLNSYFNVDDYPAEALRANVEGVTAVHLTVRANGSVSNCVVAETSGSPALDQATCAILRRRARYYPAPAPRSDLPFDPDYVRIIWRLPSR